MGKEIAETGLVDRDEKQVLLSGEMPGRRFARLFGCGQVYVAVLQVDRSTGKDTGGLGLPP
jgi:hypothetical protein